MYVIRYIDLLHICSNFKGNFYSASTDALLISSRKIILKLAHKDLRLYSLTNKIMNFTLTLTGQKLT